MRVCRLGLGPYLALTLLVLTSALTLVIVALVGATVGGNVESGIGHDLQELAFQTTDKLDRGMFERYREVELLAEHSPLGDPAITRDDKRKLLNRMQETYATYAWIGVTDRSGRIVIGTRGLLEGVDVSARPWYADAYKGVYLHDVHPGVLLAELLPGTDKLPMRFFDVAFPYRTPEGDIAGVLCVHLSWQWARDIEHSVVNPLDERHKVDTMIVDNAGIVLLGQPNMVGKRLAGASVDEARSHRAGFVVEQDADGVDYLVGYSKSQGYLSYPGYGWTVLVRQPLAEAYGPVRKLQGQIVMIGIVIAQLFSLIGFEVARRITSPVRAIALLAGQIEAGQAHSLKVRGSYREIGILASALNSLMAKLGEQQTVLRANNASLEARVATRTEDLAQALKTMAHDNALHRAAEEALRVITDRLNLIADNMPAAILYIDRDERFGYVNQTHQDWHSLPAGAFLGRRLADVFPNLNGVESRYQDIRPYVQQALRGCQVQFEGTRLIRGMTRHVEVSYVPHIEGTRVQGFYAMIRDITEHKTLQKRLEHHANHDPLTGLANRQLFLTLVDAAIARAQRSGKQLAVMFLDLNKFKQINDTLGHAAGDRVLTTFAATLADCVRKTDTVARLSGDEFVVLVEDLSDGDDAVIMIAEKIMSALQEPIKLMGEWVTLSTSIGIAILDEKDEGSHTLLSRADGAMYQAKRSGEVAWTMA
ncbi:MAG: diguanylate cyclase [Massilia sp.]